MFKRIAMIARWKPVHLGQAAVLRGLCATADEVLIGIGSSNRYNLRNPFTLEETQDMLRIVLQGQGNYRLIPVPDLDDGPRWREMVVDLFGPVDCLVTDNPYVASLLQEAYRIEHPVGFVPLNERIRVNGTMVRRAMARGEAWEHLVPPKVAAYLTARGLDARFRRTFGLEMLAMETLEINRSD